MPCESSHSVVHSREPLQDDLPRNAGIEGVASTVVEGGTIIWRCIRIVAWSRIEASEGIRGFTARLWFCRRSGLRPGSRVQIVSQVDRQIVLAVHQYDFEVDSILGVANEEALA